MGGNQSLCRGLCHMLFVIRSMQGRRKGKKVSTAGGGGGGGGGGTAPETNAFCRINSRTN